MIPDKDHYADKNGKLTTDPEQFASQVAVKGFFLDERIAKRFGITNSPEEPKQNKASARTHKVEQKQESASVVDDQPETDEPEAEEPKAAASTATVAKAEGAKKK